MEERNNDLITIAKFYAFNQINEKPYINQTDDFIKKDLGGICSTNRLISLTSYYAKKISEEKFDSESTNIVDINEAVANKDANRKK